jgi:hypothetical protein
MMTTQKADIRLFVEGDVDAFELLFESLGERQSFESRLTQDCTVTTFPISFLAPLKQVVEGMLPMSHAQLKDNTLILSSVSQMKRIMESIGYTVTFNDEAQDWERLDDLPLSGEVMRTERDYDEMISTRVY